MVVSEEIWPSTASQRRSPLETQINGWHVLRHSAASEWLSKGLSLAKTTAYLGDTPSAVPGGS